MSDLQANKSFTAQAAGDWTSLSLIDKVNELNKTETIYDQSINELNQLNRSSFGVVGADEDPTSFKGYKEKMLSGTAKPEPEKEAEPFVGREGKFRKYNPDKIVEELTSKRGQNWSQNHRWALMKQYYKEDMERSRNPLGFIGNNEVEQTLFHLNSMKLDTRKWEKFMREKPEEEEKKSMAQKHKEMLNEKYGINITGSKKELQAEAEGLNLPLPPDLSADEIKSSIKSYEEHKRKLAEKDLDYLMNTLDGPEKEEMTKTKDYLLKKGHSKEKVHGIIMNMIGE